MSNVESTALIVFAKVPEPGTVKTRLTQLLSEDQACELYTAFLLDALKQYARLAYHTRLYVAPSVSTLPSEIASLATSTHEQRGNSLGPRMAAAFEESFEVGYDKVVIIGTDHPTLPDGFIRLAFDCLEEPESVAIGPSYDGGYYLLGMNSFFPGAFEEMTYSHDRVFADTMARLQGVAGQISVLPEWYDVDAADSFWRLVNEVSGTTADLPHTRAAIADIIEHL